MSRLATAQVLTFLNEKKKTRGKDYEFGFWSYGELSYMEHIQVVTSNSNWK